MPRTATARVPLALAWIVAALCLVARDPAAQRPPVTAADSLSAVVEPLFARAQFDSILALLPAVIHHAQAAGDSLLLGRALTQRGRVALMRGRNADARRDIELGIRIAEAVRDTVGLMPAVHFRGFAYSMMGDYDEGLRCFERRLFLAQRTHAPIDEAWARTSIGYIYHRRTDNERARDEYTRAIALFRGAGADRFELTPLIGLGRVESATGHEREAIRCYQRAWVVSREVGDRLNEMWAMNNLGSLEFARGDLSRADQYQQRAFDLARELKYPSGIVIPATNLADRALERGDPETAEKVLRETRELCETQGAAEFLSMVDYRIAELNLQMGRTRAASATFRHLIHSNLLEPQHRDFVPVNLAVVLERSDSLEAAIDLLESHLRRTNKDMFDDAIAPMHMMLSGLYLRTNQPEKALDSASRARASSVASGRSRSVIAALLQESVCLSALGRNGEATDAFDAAIDSLEVFRGGISTVEWREVFGQQVAGRVVDAAQVLLEYPADTPRAAREEAFFNAIQLVKTRALLDRITEPRLGPNDATQPHRIATLDDLQAVLRPGEVLLDIHTGSSRSVMAVVTPDSLRLVELPGDDSALAERVRLFRTLLASPDEALRREHPPERVAGMQRAIGRDVLGAVAHVVKSSSRVFVAPDGYMASIPFGTLIVDDGGEVLMAGRDVVETPSATLLVRQRDLPASADVRYGRRPPAVRAPGRASGHARFDLARIRPRTGRPHRSVRAGLDPSPVVFSPSDPFLSLAHVSATCSPIVKGLTSFAQRIGNITDVTASTARIRFGRVMRIAQVAPLYESVPPSLYGGTERVVSYITEEMVKLGHDVTLFASGDSVTRARLISPCPRALRLDPDQIDPMAPHMVLLDQVFARAAEFDILHFHVDYLHFPLSRLAHVPNVTTLHGRLDLPHLHALFGHFDDMPLVSISDAQRRPQQDARWIGTVYHGLPGDLYSFNPGPEGYLAFVGRISPEKRVDRAIRIARASGLLLRVAAKIDKVDRAYFHRHIEPLLDGPGVEFVGEIGEQEKNDFLGNASALLFPIDWPEPFGLTMIEALACGTPVIAWPCGSVPEVIDEGDTGFICRSIAEAARAVARVESLSRERCRRVFEERFSAGRMADDYVRIYQRVLDWDRRAKVGEHGRDHPRSGTVLHTRNIVPS